MIFVPGSGTLHKGDALGLLVIRRGAQFCPWVGPLGAASRSIIMLVMMLGY